MTAVALSYCFPPGSFAQSPQVARFVAALDADVVVVAGDDESRDETLLRTIEPHVRVERLGWSRVSTVRRLSRRVTIRGWGARPDAYRPWVDVASRRVSRLLDHGGDLLATFGQPMSDHLAGFTASAAKGVPWLAHFSDPWLDNPYHSLGGSRRWQTKRHRWTTDRAAALVVTSEETAALITARHPSASGYIHVVPHSFDERLYPAFRPADGALVVRHVGRFYGPRSPVPLLAGLRLLLDRREDLGDVRFELIGPRWSGPIDLPQGLVSQGPIVSYLESLAMMRAADALLVIDAPSGSSPFLPSKLVDYIGAGRPVLGLTPPGAAAGAIAGIGGAVADPADVDACADALLAMLSMAGSCRGALWGAPTGRAPFTMDAQRHMIATVVSSVR